MRSFRSEGTFYYQNLNYFVHVMFQFRLDSSLLLLFLNQERSLFCSVKLTHAKCCKNSRMAAVGDWLLIQLLDNRVRSCSDGGGSWRQLRNFKPLKCLIAAIYINVRLSHTADKYEHSHGMHYY